MLNALIFDVDGTLADTESVHLDAFNHAFCEEGLDWRWDEALYIRLLEVAGGKERMAHYWRLVEPDIQEVDAGARNDAIQRLHEIKTAHYEDAIRGGAVQLRPGVLALMNEAKSQGIELAIATTTSPVNIAALMCSALGADWRSHFAAIGDAGNSPIKKPDPQVYLKVLADMGLTANRCVAFEDSSNGLRAATAAGLHTVITPNRYTAHHNFKGALRVVPDLSEVNMARLREWHV